MFNSYKENLVISFHENFALWEKHALWFTDEVVSEITLLVSDLERHSV